MLPLAGYRLLFAALSAPFQPLAASPVQPQCARGDLVLWGDGGHDDTAALNAWLRGDSLVWAATGEPVGEAIAERTFRLSAADLRPRPAPGGSSNGFRLVWLERGETVTGGSDPSRLTIPMRRRS